MFIFFSVMASILSLSSLLDSGKLIGPNFDSWYRKLKIVLEHERILYVFTDEVLEEPVANAPHTVRDTYVKWLNDCTIMHCVMRIAMNDELSCKFEDT